MIMRSRDGSNKMFYKYGTAVTFCKLILVLYYHFVKLIPENVLFFR